MDLCQYAKQLWKLYILCDEQETARKLLEAMDENVTIIGTGKHEFYEDRNTFARAFDREGPEREEIVFRIQSLWAKELPAGGDVRVIYGGCHVTGTGRQADVAVDMDTRYSMVFRQIDGIWKVIHIHQSLPYREQQEGEYYPKTLLDQVEEANRRAARMEKLAKTDQMTGLLNHHSFYEECSRLLEEKGSGYCMTIDLDDFKRINDSYGHQEGDAVLQEVGKILRQVVGQKGVAGRIGGDEFALFSGELFSNEEACAMAGEIMAQVDLRISDKEVVFPGVSIGISQVRAGEGLKNAFRRADVMLYEVKRNGKHGYRFYG